MRIRLGPSWRWSAAVVILAAIPTVSGGDWTPFRIGYTVAFTFAAIGMLTAQGRDWRQTHRKEGWKAHSDLRWREGQTVATAAVLAAVNEVKAEQSARVENLALRESEGRWQARFDKVVASFDQISALYSQVIDLYDFAANSVEEIAIVTDAVPVTTRMLRPSLTSEEKLTRVQEISRAVVRRRYGG